MRIHLVTAVSILLSGCATMPKADIALIQQPSDLDGKELDTYAFPRSFVEIAYNEDQTDVTIRVTSRAYEKFRIGLREADSFGVKTNLNLTKLANSDIIDEAGVEVSDNRIKVIGEIGKLAAGVIAMAAAAGSEDKALPDLPVSFEAMDILENHTDRQGDSKEKRSGVPGITKVQYWLGPVQPDAQQVTPEAFKSYHNGLVYASCREVKLYVGDRQGVSTYISDPRFFRYVAFPQKGKVKIQPQCGTSVTSVKEDSVATDTAVANAVMDQINTLKEAVDKLRKGDGSS